MTLDRLETSTERRRLPGRTERRGSHTGFPSAGAYLFGAIFVAVGTGVALVGLRVIPVNPQDVHAPWWTITAMGLVFAAAGAGMLGMSVRQHRAERRARDAAWQHPGRPTLGDYTWDPRGFAAPRWSRAVKALAGAAGISLFLSIFNWWAFATDSPFMVKAITVVFDLLLILIWIEALRRVGVAVKFGGSRVEFTRFPYEVGGAVIVRWRPAAGIARARRGTFTLRSVEERFEHRGSGGDRSARLVQEETWSATWHLDREATIADDRVVEVRFDPPPDAAPTRLHAPQPVFWEFQVTLDLPGLDFDEIYLVPVYGR